MRTVFHGGRVFDGTGADLAPGDVAVEDGRIVEVGTGLDGDEGVGCSGKAVLPGLFDTHVHLTSRYEDDELTIQHRPFSYGFYLVPGILRQTLALGITTVRDAGGADAGLRQAVADGVLVGPRMQVVDHDAQPDRRPQRRRLAQRRRSRRAGCPYPGFPDGGLRRRGRRAGRRSAR